MTGPEVEAALRRRGHGATAAKEAGGLLRLCDENRYRPGEPEPGWCRERFAAALELVAAARVPARFTPVPPELALEGEKCWTRLDAWRRETLAAAAAVGAGEDGRA